MGGCEPVEEHPENQRGLWYFFGLAPCLHVCTKGSWGCFKQLVILTVHLVLDPLVQSPFSREVLGVIIGLLPNSAKERGKLGRELLEQRSYV